MNLSDVSRDDWIVGGLALLLAIVLLFFPWFTASISVEGFTASASISATGSPDGWLGVLAVLAALGVVADLTIEQLSPHTTVPVIGGSRAATRLVLSVAAAVFVALKFLFHLNYFSGIVTYDWGFYLAVVLTGALVYFAAKERAAAV
jgi:hypothetical protein